MAKKRLKVLLLVEQCDPEGMSVPLLGYRFAEQICQFCDVTLVTRAKYLAKLQAQDLNSQVIGIEESSLTKVYSQCLARYTLQRSINWPLWHALKYPLYAAFNRAVSRRFAQEVRAGHYDLVHAITPMIPRYPVKLANACAHVPFVIGPVNGGLPFPQGFSKIAKQEYSHFNVLRRLVNQRPAYRRTYTKAAKILVGSDYTQKMLKQLLKLDANALQKLAENGIPEKLLCEENTLGSLSSRTLHLLFVGRLVPYKGAQFVLEAMGRLPKGTAVLTLVGDGPERKRLEQLALVKGLKEHVHFTGWVSQGETSSYYRHADVFCFPSVREFGGAVVLEAMAHGLPCIVADNGGIGEYITEDCGIKLHALSEQQMTHDIATAIERLSRDSALYHKLSVAARNRASLFTWEAKRAKLEQLYEELTKNRRSEQKLAPALPRHRCKFLQ